MKKTPYSIDVLVQHFHQNKVITLADMKVALGTHVKMTVFRKLKTLAYRASYSHAGKYYTLDEIALYDQYGLWNYGVVHFSKYGNLLETLEALVCASEAGYFAAELKALLKVRVYDPLLKLYSTGRLLRKQIIDEYLYLYPTKHTLQLENRNSRIEATVAQRRYQRAPAFASPEINEALESFLSTLNEKQRRLYVGFESLKLGHGGDSLMAKITGMNIKTIARGRKELQSRQIIPDRIRKIGAGRHSLEKKRKS